MRRPALIVLALVLAAGLVGAARWARSGAGDVHGPGWYARAVYPLEHDDAIRASARRNRLDPALVAALIYVESRFDARARSSRGAVGLMQVLPGTAAQIARETGGVRFVPGDLEDPRVNVRYGTYYLRALLDQFDGDALAAVAAYNAGAGAVGEWVATAHADGHGLRLSDIPYPETQAYVRRVLGLRGVYRHAYGDRLRRAS